MEPKGRFDALMQIANFAIARADARHEYEWKISFGIWGALSVLLIQASAQSLSVWIGFAFLGFYALWLCNIMIRHENDQRIAWCALRRAVPMASSIIRIPRGFPKPCWIKKLRRGNCVVKIFGSFLGLLFDWSLRLQLLFTAALIALFYVSKVTVVTWFSLPIICGFVIQGL